MKMLIEIADNKAASFQELVKQHFDVKAKPISSPDAAIFEEIMHIKKAFKNLEKVKVEIPLKLTTQFRFKLTTRSASN